MTSAPFPPCHNCAQCIAPRHAALMCAKLDMPCFDARKPDGPCKAEGVMFEVKND